MKAKFLADGRCSCGHLPQPSVHPPGYGVRQDGSTFCIDCLTEEQAKRLTFEGRGTLIFDDTIDARCVRNEANTLRFDVQRVSESGHNIARIRRDIYFVGPDDMRWQGVAFGYGGLSTMKVRRCTGIHQLREQVRLLGCSLYLRDGKYRVNLRHGAEQDAYYTADPVDAFRAAHRKVAERDAPQPIRMDW